MKSGPIAVVAALIVLGCVVPVRGETSSTTSYTYYAVSGSTPREIYAAILRRGPTVQGAKALATTTADADERHTLRQTSSSCEVVDFNVRFHFVVNLPSIPNEYVLPPEDRALWQDFAAFLKAHELHHTKLWLGCAADLEDRVRALRLSTCDDLTHRADEMWKEMRASCGQSQADFDEEQRTELAQQPFLRKVMRGGQR